MTSFAISTERTFLGFDDTKTTYFICGVIHAKPFGQADVEVTRVERLSAKGEWVDITGKPKLYGHIDLVQALRDENLRQIAAFKYRPSLDDEAP